MRKPRNERERLELLGSICRQELSRAEGGGEDELQAQRAEALDYYFARPRGDEVADRSQVVSTDVADSVNATLAMMRDMLIRDAEISIDPDGDDDEVAARAEADVLNDVVMLHNNGEKEILAAVRDALLLKNGCLKVHVSESETVEKVSVAGAEDIEVAAFLGQLAPNQVADRDGDELTIRTTERRFEVRAVPIENVSYQANFWGPLQEVRFFAERIPYTRSELVALGVKKAQVEKLQPWSEYSQAAGQSRNVSFQDGAIAETRDQDVIECFECYVLVDLDGDGVSERYMVLYANDNAALMYEPAELVPYAMGSPFLVPHRLTGESLFDRLRQTQDTNTALTRQLLDNVTVINNGRYAYDPSQVSEEDVLTPKAGGGIRARNPAQAVVPIMVPDVTSGILTGLEYSRRVRSEKVGAALDMASAEAQLVQKSATAASIEKGNQELISSMIAANLASTMIRDLYHILHETMRRWALTPFKVTIAGQSSMISPQEWKPRSRFVVRCGMSPSERSQLLFSLSQHLQLQAQAISGGLGGILADAKTLHRTATEWLRLSGVDSAERFLIDPQSPQAQQAAQAQQQQQQEAQRAAQQAQLAQLQLEQAKLAEDARQADGELRHKYYDTDMEAAIAEAKVAGEGVIGLEKQRMANEAARQKGAGEGAAGIGGNA